MSSCSCCCPWRKQVEIDSKSQQSSGIEATSTPTSGCAFIKANDANNNKKEDCSVSGQDVDDSVVIKQPLSDRSSDVERIALMRSALASSGELDHGEGSFSYQRVQPLELEEYRYDRDAIHDNDCSKAQDLDSTVDLRDEMELLLISDQNKMQESDLFIEDSSMHMASSSNERDFDNENGLQLNLMVDFDEQPDQELLDLFLEVLNQRPVQAKEEPKPVQGQVRKTAIDAMTEDDLIESIEARMADETVVELRVPDTNMTIDSEMDQVLSIPSIHEQNEELLQLLRTVHQQRVKQGRQKQTSQSKPQIKPYKRIRMPLIPPVNVTSENQLNAFELQMLEAHNYYRAHHSAPSLKHCPELRLRAQNWADYIASRDLQLLEPQELDGNNWGCVEVPDGCDEINGAFFVNGWYKQCQHYAFFGQKLGQTAPINYATTAHFEQLVWNNTQRVGFGRAVSASGRVFVVARYRPPGRVHHQFEANVLPPVDGLMAQPI